MQWDDAGLLVQIKIWKDYKIKCVSKTLYSILKQRGYKVYLIEQI